MRWIALPVLLALAGCGENEAEKAETDQKAREAVQAANEQKPPIQPISPQVIGFPDMERHNIFGASCAFVPEGGGVGAIFLAMQEGAYLKLNGEIVTLAPDAGSAELPYGGREKNDGKAYSATLIVDEESGKQAGTEVVNYPGKLIIRDAYGRTLLDRSGIAQCGA